MYARIMLAGAIAAVLGIAPASGQNTGEQIERVVVNYNDDGMARITPAVIQGYLRALYAEQAAGGDFWKSGGFDFPVEFRKVDERIHAFLAIAYQGTRAAIFSPEELTALEARRKDLDAALKRDWANVNLGSAAPQANAPSDICAELNTRLRELQAAWTLGQQRASERQAEIGRAQHEEVYMRDIARRLHEDGRRGLTERELSEAEMARWAKDYGVSMSPTLRDSPYAFYLTVAGKAQARVELLKQNNPVQLPTSEEFARVQQQLTQNNCPKEPEP